VIYLNFLKPVILKILAALRISFGMVFKPPIMENTKFQSIAMKRIKITAPSVAWSLIKTKTTTGKKAKIGTDWTMSEIGRRIRSVCSFLVIKSAIGIEKNKAKIYEIKSLKSVLNEASKMTVGESWCKFKLRWGVT
jgi:hypothetical protein